MNINGLTPRSQTFLLSKEEERDELIERYRGKKLLRKSMITCMTTMKKSSSDISDIDCIIIGTEIGIIYCIDSQAFTVLSQCILPAQPVFIYASGKFLFLFLSSFFFLFFLPFYCLYFRCIFQKKKKKQWRILNCFQSAMRNVREK